MNYSQIQQDFQRAYSRSAWSHMISQIFPGAQLWARPDKLTDIDNHAAKEAYKLGQITLDENGIERTISVFEVQLAPGIVLERNRVGLRNLLKKYWKYMDGAFVSYYQPGKPNWRFTYVSELTGWDAEGEQFKIQTEPKRYTYILGETETCRTAAERFAILSEKGRSAGLKDVMDAFSVEKLSKAFFDEYKLHYQKFCDFMLSKPGISTALFNNDDKAIRDFAKKMLGRIVFLYFIQKKGWLGVPVGKTWGEGDPEFLTNLFIHAPFKSLFYSSYLTKLFFDTLNTPRANDEIEIIPGNLCRIPYLNGGLFEEENPLYRQINFPPELFFGLFDFFSHYNFTIYEDDPDDQIVAVDPEMLGHIFENLLEDNKDKGAFYTPKEIVHYMCQESLTEYLATWFEQKGYQVTGYREFAKQDEPLLFPPNEGRIGQQVLEIAADSPDKAIDRIIIENLLKKRLSPLEKIILIQHADEINEALDNVKICDPAIGSGAFPMGLLHEIFSAKQALFEFEHGNLDGYDTSAVKLNIIQNSIYGVDIEKGAVDIARLRFWLSLIVDEPIPKPLPNLDYKIVVGDSLVAKLKIGDTEEIVDIDWKLKPEMHGLYGRDLMEQKSNLFKSLIQKQKAHFHPESDKRRLAVEIRNLKIDLLINQLELMVKNKGTEVIPSGTGQILTQRTELYLQTLRWKQLIVQLNNIKVDHKKSLSFFDWKLDFSEVMNQLVKEKYGFDIVIGNPPYVDSENMTINTPELRQYLREKFSTTKGNWDLFVPFIEQGVELTTNKGIFTYIIPNKVLSANYSVDLRKYLSNKSIIEIRDYSRINVFKEVNVYPVTLILKNKIKKNSVTMAIMESNQIVKSSNQIDPKVFYKDILWDKYFFHKECVRVLIKLSLLPKMGNISNLKILGAATVNEAYLFKEILFDSKYINGAKKFINTGTIDKWISLWGKKKTQYIKNSYEYPIIYNTDIQQISPTRFLQAESPKIIIAGMSNEIEAYLDYDSQYLAGKSTTIFLSDINNLKIITAILNSKAASFFVLFNFHSLKMAGGYLNISNEILSNIPFPFLSTNQKNNILKVVNLLLDHIEKDKDISFLMQHIDNVVYKLYGLTYDEVKVVDPEFPLSDVEYAAIKTE